ncbi:MAG TPA: branched-chain amino acid ABC transporter permease [Microbacterium sp.]|uniref:branched-chain amino acid ABC transporter permease n=1 Tax=Microbacterium sp. TaxID=51671 RepID=UPI002C26946F|nr:branched-chain amino acid ABC transporter permease [Microbacterium sp.]HWI32175.1 branched-chain amino acid ABC transporter permease [Microbacterium sp.]
MTGPTGSAPRRSSRIPYSWIIGGAIVIFAFVFPYIVDRPQFWLPNVGVRTCWLGIIALSLVFLNRYVGLLSLAQVAIAGIAAYGIGVSLIRLELPVIPSIIIGLAAGTAAGFVTALIAARTRAIYFLMITLALGQVFYAYASQAEDLGGRGGLRPVRKPDFGFIDFNDATYTYFLAVTVAVLCYLLCRYVASTSFGLVLQGIRDSPARMSALGYRVNRYRTAAITFAAFIASVGGTIMVFDRAQADPSMVSLTSTLDVLVVAVIGGIGSLGGVFVGALVLALLDNFAQDLTDRYMTLTGLIFIIVLLFAPSGLAGLGPQVKRAIDRRRKERTPDSVSSPQHEPSATQPADEAIHEGKQR